LRLTPTRVRQLLQAGELEGERDAAGHWLIPARAVHERLERLRRESFLEAVGYDPAGSSVSEMRDLVEVLRSQVEMLRAELHAAHAANRETRRIIAVLSQWFPELGASGSAQSATGEQARTEPRYGTGAPQEDYGRPRDTAEFPVGGTLLRPWWRRVFGG